MTNYALAAGNSYNPDPTEPIMESIFKQYERVLVESLISAFGLDFLVRHRYGGDVDTIHNVRQIDTDPQMTYKNQANAAAYDNRGAYNSYDYHHNPAYIAKNREVSAQRKAGTLRDAYTGERIGRNERSDLDHVISANEIHNDRGRVLAELSGTELANCEENLKATTPHTNRSKKADSMNTYLEKHGGEYTDAQKANMRKIDATARKSYEAKLAKAYYTSPKFAKDLAVSAGRVSAAMGARQALGYVFAEMWFAVKEEFHKIGSNFNLGEFLTAIGHGIQRGFENAKEKYRELFSRFLSGSIAGAYARTASAQNVIGLYDTSSKEDGSEGYLFTTDAAYRSATGSVVAYSKIVKVWSNNRLNFNFSNGDSECWTDRKINVGALGAFFKQVIRA